MAVPASWTASGGAHNAGGDYSEQDLPGERARLVMNRYGRRDAACRQRELPVASRGEDGRGLHTII
jgi:hypothetical protein